MIVTVTLTLTLTVTLTLTLTLTSSLTLSLTLTLTLTVTLGKATRSVLLPAPVPDQENMHTPMPPTYVPESPVAIIRRPSGKKATNADFSGGPPAPQEQRPAVLQLRGPQHAPYPASAPAQGPSAPCSSQPPPGAAPPASPAPGFHVHNDVNNTPSPRHAAPAPAQTGQRGAKPTSDL